ncbi:hypothetical protein [Sorangium sp. So ce693]|uniref:hypothetical protein n=1 Tax=Sorangium sp. So ce693 TaxID=3133318 RepID=UPI003F6118FC
MPLTPDAKKLLAETLRGSVQDPEKGIRSRLLRATHDEADRLYRLSVPTGEAGLEEAHRRRRERIESWIDERACATKPKSKARHWHEIDLARTKRPAFWEYAPDETRPWVHFIKGADARAWFEPLSHLVHWNRNGLQLGTYEKSKFGREADRYFSRGVAYSTIGASFTARAHRDASIFSDAGSSAFLADVATAVCVLNSSMARHVPQSLNPTVNFTNGDVERVPMVGVAEAREVFARIGEVFDEHEAASEASPDFVRPGPSAWRYAQAWVQTAIDRPDGHPRPAFEPERDYPPAEAFISFALGVVLARFDPSHGGVRASASGSALPRGLLVLSSEGFDSLDHPACEPLHVAWREHNVVGQDKDLWTYLRRSFFTFHKKLYDGTPIYFPLSSSKRSFVVLASTHRWSDTLSVLLAGYLVPTKRRLDRELENLRFAKASATNKANAENRFAEVQRLAEELDDFIVRIAEVAERGRPKPDGKTIERAMNSRFVMVMEDGVMVNDAALWSLLEPQWKDPKKWWSQVANESGPKATHFDWSHLAARYFPTRVRKKCQENPSFAVAHKCFWALHSGKAYAWELRLQDEVGPNFTIDEPGSADARASFLKEHEREAREILAKEMKRRERRDAKGDDADAGPLFDDADSQDAEEADA